MKKKVPVLLICVFLIFVAVFIGIFLGRTSRKDIIYLPSAQKSVEENRYERSTALNLNTATIEELKLIPGISHSLAREIIEYRDQFGDFVYVSELKRINGMTNQLYDSIKEYVTVTG